MIVVREPRPFVAEVGASERVPENAPLLVVQSEPPPLVRVLVLDDAPGVRAAVRRRLEQRLLRTTTPGRAPAQPQSMIWIVTVSGTRPQSKALASRAFRAGLGRLAAPGERVRTAIRIGVGGEKQREDGCHRNQTSTGHGNR